MNIGSNKDPSPYQKPPFKEIIAIALDSDLK